MNFICNENLKDAFVDQLYTYIINKINKVITF